jgi:hypothetical protein
MSKSIVPKSKICTKCEKRKNLKSFAHQKLGLYKRAAECKKCHSLRYQGDQDTHRDKTNQRNAHMRYLCLSHYSDGQFVCDCCDIDNIEFLTIDHINGGGNKHRRQIARTASKTSGGGPVTYGWLIEHNYPSGFRVLCFNCNTSMGLYKYCPHSNEAKSTKRLIWMKSYKPSRISLMRAT